jgi:hypothetical protein
VARKPALRPDKVPFAVVEGAGSECFSSLPRELPVRPQAGVQLAVDFSNKTVSRGLRNVFWQQAVDLGFDRFDDGTPTAASFAEWKNASCGGGILRPASRADRFSASTSAFPRASASVAFAAALRPLLATSVIARARDRNATGSSEATTFASSV